MREPIRTLLRQLEGIGCDAYPVPHVTYDHTRRLPSPQVVLVDVSSADYERDGAIPQSIRSTWEYVPVLLVAHRDEIMRIRFTANLYDFFTLPITPPELETRIRCAHRKLHGSIASRELLEIGELRINTATYEVWVSNQRVELTYKEYELLKYFITHPRRVFSRPELLETIWNTDYYGGTRTVDVHIRRLRVKLGPSIGDLIHTVRNVGYRFG